MFCEIFAPAESVISIVTVTLRNNIKISPLLYNNFLAFLLYQSPFALHPFALSPFRPFTLSPFRPFALSPFRPFALSPFHPFALRIFVSSFFLSLLSLLLYLLPSPSPYLPGLNVWASEV
jgi:hypothetical protein